MLTGRRYILDFTAEQSTFAEEIADVCRAVWNIGLEQRREYCRRGASIGYVEQARQMADAKKDPDCAWLAVAPSHTLQQTLIDLDRACRIHGPWKVRWRSKSRNAPSFRFPNPAQIPVRRMSRRWGQVWLAKFGLVRFRWSRSLGGTVRNATVNRDRDRWYISFCVEDGMIEAAPNDKPPVGIDLGVKVAVATSDGELYDRAFVTSGEQLRLRRLQKKISRSLRTHGRDKTSRRRESARTEFRRLTARICARRADFAAQTAVRLARNHGVVALENLPIAKMTASARGTVEQPGKNVRQKAGLNRAILSKGWGMFRLRLEYAARYHGATVVKVSPAYTSQTCHACKHVARESRESQAVFRCVACGHRDHADVNAAKNILAAGLAVTGRGDLGVGRSAKRQPPERPRRAMLHSRRAPSRSAAEEEVKYRCQVEPAPL